MMKAVTLSMVALVLMSVVAGEALAQAPAGTTQIGDRAVNVTPLAPSQPQTQTQTQATSNGSGGMLLLLILGGVAGFIWWVSQKPKPRGFVPLPLPVPVPRKEDHTLAGILILG